MVRGLLIAVASLLAKHFLQGAGVSGDAAHGLRRRGPQAGEDRLSRGGGRAAIFPDRGANLQLHYRRAGSLLHPPPREALRAGGGPSEKRV